MDVPSAFALSESFEGQISACMQDATATTGVNIKKICCEISNSTEPACLIQ